ncbi:DUF2071 domain-containing protein [Tumebacillus sp. ITR2]|uniref:DUF2071 domain-containing protein n=1 Tax=Tumebacillus amylolyticus TaxID=2801339 RepID=A0ABS1JEA6_9BACL|nr:DUF2071 domain-containing protein [Tumebacillus amylolyticus]MBL0388628.1 DUF2071 domain-containing protein [Tumebacillus amylolyticus]
MKITHQVEHRPYPIPTKLWVMTQTWNRLLFAHWPIPVSAIREHIPKELEVDTYNGVTYIGVVPFDMSDIRARFFPQIPYTNKFPELNVRAYVTRDGKPGVYFFSLDASNLLAVSVARGMFSLPYFHAQMSSIQRRDTIEYQSQRIHSNAPAGEFVAAYRPTSEVYYAEPGTLDHWLTERYCLYTMHGGHLYRGDIHHVPWPLRQAGAEFEKNTMLDRLNLPIDDPLSPPILHYVDSIMALIWPLVKVTG